MLYGDTLAFVLRRGWGLVDEAAPQLLKLLRASGVTRGHVVDLGCGDGEWLRIPTAAGFDASGFDQSRAFVTRARRTAPNAIVHQASIYRVAFPPCDAMTALEEAFSYLSEPPRANSLARLFVRIFAALRPGRAVALRRVGARTGHER